MTHPKHHVAKVYHGILKGVVQREDIEKLRTGVTLDDGYVTQPAQAKYLGPAGSHSRVEITVYEGKNHQVRRMARAIGHPVLRLRRVRWAVCAWAGWRRASTESYPRRKFRR